MFLFLNMKLNLPQLNFDFPTLLSTKMGWLFCEMPNGMRPAPPHFPRNLDTDLNSILCWPYISERLRVIWRWSSIQKCLKMSISTWVQIQNSIPLHEFREGSQKCLSHVAPVYPSLQRHLCILRSHFPCWQVIPPHSKFSHLDRYAYRYRVRLFLINNLACTNLLTLKNLDILNNKSWC